MEQLIVAKSDYVIITPDQLEPKKMQFGCGPGNRPAVLEFPRFMLDYINQRHNWSDIELMVLEQFVQEGIYTCYGGMMYAFSKIEAAALNKDPTIIFGASGTGKELAAKAIWKKIGADAEFVIRNCAEFTESLIDSELFGHKKGSGTGITYERPGIFEDKAVVFLDEVDKMSMSAQGKLLRVIENKKTTRVGENKARDAKFIKIICATNKDLSALCIDGKFLSDFYNRIHVGRVDLPPLKERGGLDVEMLIHYFLIKESVEHFKEYPPGKSTDWKAIGIPRGLCKKLRADIVNRGYSGNVRGVQNHIKEIVAHGLAIRSMVEKYHTKRKSRDHKPWSYTRAISQGFDFFLKFSGRPQVAAAAPTEPQPTAPKSEKERMRNAMLATKTNKEACEMLVMKKSTFYYKKKKFGL